MLNLISIRSANSASILPTGRTGVFGTVIALLLICIGLPSFSYQADGEILLQPSRPSITASNEELVDLTLKIVNRSGRTLAGALTVNVPQSIDLITKPSVDLSLAAGDSIYIPVKIFITRRTISNQTHTVHFQIGDEQNNVLVRTESKIQVSVKRNVNMQSLISNILLDAFTDSIRIPVRISNPGNTAQTVTIVNRYPSAFQDNAFHTTTNVTLQPSADTLITFSKAVSRKMYNSDGFDVTFTGLYSNGDVLGMAYVRVQSARSNRVFKDLSLGDSYNENFISLSSQGMFTDNQTYLLMGRGNIALPHGRVGYNLDLTTWKNNYTPAMMRSTYITLESRNMGLTAGNINRNMDVNLNGRGASFFINDTASNNLYEAGYIDGSNNLLGDHFNNFLPSGEAGWASFTKTGKDWSLGTSAVYESNPMLNSRSVLFSNNFVLTKIKALRITANASAGHTSELLDPENRKPSMALGLGMSGTIKNVAVNSTNYFSSGYYPGLRRGALSLNERVTWMREGSNIWAAVDYNRYAPKSFSSYQFISPEFGTLRAEAGISGSVFKKVMGSIAPLYTHESNNSYRIPGILDTTSSLNSWNLVGSLNYTMGNNRYFSLNVESGFYSSTFDTKQRFHLRSNLNYRRGNFNLSSSAQLGVFYLGEAANNFIRKEAAQRIINIIPSYQKMFFRNKLRTEAGIAYTNTSFSGNNFYLTGRAEYDVMPKTSVYTSVNHNRYSNYSLSLLEMGITQKIAVPKVGAKSTDLQVFVYKDINQNGRYDEADQPAAGHLIYVNNAAFISSNLGLAEYRNLPYENYRVTSSNAQGWYAPDQYIKLDQKKQRIEIGLKQTGTVKGSVNYVFNEFSYDINRNLQGLTIIATDINGAKYVTKTNSDGQFVFYLPLGRYTVMMDTAGLPAEIEVETQPEPFQLEIDKPQNLTFKLLVKSRKIETKKFTSPNSSKRR